MLTFYNFTYCGIKYEQQKTSNGYVRAKNTAQMLAELKSVTWHFALTKMEK